MIRRTLITIAAAAALVAVAAPVSGAFSAPARRPAPKPRIANVYDDYFTPSTLTINRGASVKWKWDPYNGNTHNVTLSRAPRGVKRGQFRSSSGAIGIRFVRKFTVPGSYRFVCTLHRSVMQMTVTVKKPRR